MRLVDERGRLFGRINLVDLIVLLLVVGFSARLAYTWLGPRASVARSTRPIAVTVLISGVRSATADAIKPGDEVAETRTNDPLGRVTGVRVQPMRVLDRQPDGRYLESTSGVYKDVYVTLLGEGEVTANAILLGGHEVHIGSELRMKTRLWGVIATVWSIDLNPAEGK